MAILDFVAIEPWCSIVGETLPSCPVVHIGFTRVRRPRAAMVMVPHGPTGDPPDVAQDVTGVVRSQVILDSSESRS